MAEAALDALLAKLGTAETLDDEIREYISSALEPDNLDDATVDVLQQVLCCCSSFSALSVDDQTALVVDLVEQVQLQQQNGQASPKDTGSHQSTLLSSALIPAMAAIAPQDTTDRVEEEQQREQEQRQQQQQARADRERQYSGQIQTMLEVCGSSEAMSRDFLLHVLLEECSGDLEAAVTWLLDCPHLGAAQHAWGTAEESAQQASKEAEAERQRHRKQLLEKYDLQVVGDASSKAGKGKGKPLQAWPSNKQEPKAAKVRYRDDAVVSCRGDKYIIEKVGEEWDGGSKGKVYTKGKRGKGFV